MHNTKIKVPCPKCRKEFSAKASSIKAGLTLTCEFCKTPVRITDAPEDEGIRKALSAARKIRRQVATP